MMCCVVRRVNHTSDSPRLEVGFNVGFDADEAEETGAARPRPGGADRSEGGRPYDGRAGVQVGEVLLRVGASILALE